MQEKHNFPQFSSAQGVSVVPIYRNWVHTSVSVFGSVKNYPPKPFGFPIITSTIAGICSINLPTLVSQSQTPNQAAPIHFWHDLGDFTTKIKEAAHTQFAAAFPKIKTEMFVNGPSANLTTYFTKTKQRKQKIRSMVEYYAHGTPTIENGDLWFLNQRAYEKMNVRDMIEQAGYCSLFIFDCDNAGSLIPFFQETKNDVFAFFAVDEGEIIPRSCGLPADLFTACLITPARMALLWHSRHYFCFKNGPLKPLTPFFPDECDASTPFDDIYRNVNTLLKGIVEAMALRTMGHERFTRIFRTDHAIAQLAVNFVLAQRIFSFFEKTPRSFPDIPDLTKHSLWNSFDMRMDAELFRLQKIPKILPIPFTQYLEQARVALDNAVVDAKPEVDFFPEVSFLPTMLSIESIQEKACDTLAKFLDRSTFCVSAALHFSFSPTLIRMLKRRNCRVSAPVFCMIKFINYEPQMRMSLIDHQLDPKTQQQLVQFSFPLLYYIQQEKNPTLLLILATLMTKDFMPGISSFMRQPSWGRAIIPLTKVQHRDVRIWAMLLLSNLVPFIKDERIIEQIFRESKVEGSEEPLEVIIANIHLLTQCITGSQSDFQLALMNFIVSFKSSPFYIIRCQVLAAISHALQKSRNQSEGKQAHAIDALFHSVVSELASDPHQTVSHAAMGIAEGMATGENKLEPSKVLDSFCARLQGRIYKILPNSEEVMSNDPMEMARPKPPAPYIREKPFKAFKIQYEYKHPTTITSNLVYIDQSQVLFGDQNGSITFKNFGDSKAYSTTNVSNYPIMHTDLIENCGYPLLFVLNSRGVCQAFSRKENEMRLSSVFTTDQNSDSCKRDFSVDDLSGRLFAYRTKQSQSLPIFDLRSERVIQECNVGGRVKYAAWAGSGSQLIGTLIDDGNPLFKIFDIRTKSAIFNVALSEPGFEFRVMDFANLEFVVATEIGDVDRLSLNTSQQRLVASVQIMKGIRATSFAFNESTRRCIVGHTKGLSLVDLSNQVTVSLSNYPRFIGSGPTFGKVTGCVFHPTVNAMNVQNSDNNIVVLYGQNEE